MKPLTDPFQKKVWFFSVGLALILSVSMGFAEEGAIIKIETQKTATGETAVITPVTLTIEKDTIAIWLNLIDKSEADIIFENSKKTIAASKHRTGFFTDDKGRLLAQYMPHVATASMRFVEAGTFPYMPWCCGTGARPSPEKSWLNNPSLQTDVTTKKPPAMQVAFGF